MLSVSPIIRKSVIVGDGLFFVASYREIRSMRIDFLELANNGILEKGWLSM